MDKSLKFDYKICIFQGDDEGGRIGPDTSGLSSKIG